MYSPLAFGPGFLGHFGIMLIGAIILLPKKLLDGIRKKRS